MKADDFNLPDQNGLLHSLKEYSGGWLVLYFYPTDDTPGCTKEACSFRDWAREFKSKGAEIVGISKDSVASHKKFADKYHLNFTILSDTNHATIEKYGSWAPKKFFGREFIGTHRNTFLINPGGEIVKEYEGVNPLTHTKEVLADLDHLQSQ